MNPTTKPKKPALRKPTPKAMRIYKKHNLLDEGEDNRDNAIARIKLAADVAALKEVLDVTCVKTFTEAEIEEINLQDVWRWIEDFFFSLFVTSGRSAKPNKTS